MGDAQLIVTHFCIPEHVTRVAALGEGFINDTFLVQTSAKQQYILQRKNRSVFPNIPGMMDNINKVTSHILSKGGTTFSLTATKDGTWYHRDPDGEYLSLIHISEPTRLLSISYAVSCLKKTITNS